MTSGRLRECLNILRWSATDLAAQLNCGEAEVTSWLDGRSRSPIAVAAWLEALAKAHRMFAPPELRSGTSVDSRPILIAGGVGGKKASKKPIGQLHS